MAGNDFADSTAFQQSAPAGDRPLSSLSTANDLQRKFDALVSNRGYHEREWKVNLAFYKGRQYTFWNVRTRRIETLPVEDGEKPRYRVRLVSNQIAPGVRSHIARLLKTKPQMMATPGSGSMSDLQAAQMCERLLEYWWDDFKLDDSLEEALVWADVAGQGYWKIDWDEGAGKQMTFVVAPDGSPILDDSLKEEFASQLAQVGLQPQQQVVYMGDICVSTISPFDLVLDPSARQFKDCKYAFEVCYVDPDTLKAQYGVNLPPNAITGPPDLGLPFGNIDQQPMDVRKVITGYFVPQPALPKGRIVTWSGGHILRDTPWDLPFNELPFIKFPGVRVPGELYDTSLTTQAIPIQKELNRTVSQIVEFKNLTVRPQWKSPIGSLRQRRTDEPGAIWEYNPIGPAGLGPEPLTQESLPSYVFTHLENIQGRLDAIFGSTEVTQGTVPPNVEAGIAIDLLQEMATDKDAPTIRLIEIALERAGRMMLQLAKKFYIEPRVMRIRGSGGSYQVYQFTKSDLDGSVDVQVETGSGLPRTRAGRQSRIMEFIQQGIIAPDQAYKYLDIADLKGLQAQFALDEDQAYREHDKLNTGQPISPVNVYEAEQQIQQLQEELVEIYGPPGGLGAPWSDPNAPPNPDTGQPFQSWEEFGEWAQNRMQQAAVQANMIDNHAVHIDVHSRFMKSTEYQSLEVDIQEQYVQHIQSHYNILFTLPSSTQGEAPKINLQIKSTAGPTVQSKILEKAGVFVTPQDSSEPPLDSWVSDNLNQPEAQLAANQPPDPNILNEWATTIAESQAKVVQQTNAQNAQALQSSVATETDVLGKQQTARHAEEKHQMEMQILKAKLANEKRRGGNKMTKKVMSTDSTSQRMGRGR